MLGRGTLQGGELDVPKMDLPKPGESLFGKPSKNKSLGISRLVDDDDGVYTAASPGN